MESIEFKTRDGSIIETAVCVAYENDADVGCLSRAEYKRYCEIKHSGAKTKFILGRYSAKKAFLHLSGSKVEMKDIDIANGIFGNPILYDSRYDVSISHTESNGECIGAAIVFDRGIPMGIDTEAIRAKKIDVLRKTSPEIDPSNIEMLTAAWCFKEALSKALKIGLTIPTELFKIAELTKTAELVKNEDSFECRYEIFSQYHGYGRTNGSTIVTIVYPAVIRIVDA